MLHSQPPILDLDSQRSISDDDDVSEAELEECPTPHLSPIPNELTKHYTYCQPCEIESYSSSNHFVVCADTQFGAFRFDSRAL